MKRILVILFLTLFFFGCAGLQPSVPEPTVSINSFKVLPSNSIAPRFEINLRIVNTARTALDIEGVVYTVDLQGNRILTGVAKDIPTIESYSEANVTVSGSPDLFGSFSLLGDLMKQQGESISYEVDVSIDVGSFEPMLHTTKKGEFSLSDAMKAKSK